MEPAATNNTAIQKEDSNPNANPASSNTNTNTFVGLNGEVTGLGFATRDLGAKTEEDQGMIEFTIIRNDRTHQNMKLLIDLKNIFARQLPKMPKEYIVKLVFDRNHEAMVILKNKQKVIGGICYRMYPTQRFAEIAFLAITATEQVRGYGTRLMNKYKERMQKLGIEYLVTYADNFALGYFKKQGFITEIRMPQERWKGFIKDYDGGTFMECYIHPKMDYQNISTILKNEKNFLTEQVKNLSINDHKYPGLNFEVLMKKQPEPGQQATETTIQIPVIPGIMEGGWVLDDYHQLKKAKERTFLVQCQNIIDLLTRQKNAWPFLKPVNKDEVPDYYDVIKNPIDLETIQKRLKANYYTEKETFVGDIKRIFSNARFYNNPDTIYYKSSNDLEAFIDPFLASLKVDRQEKMEGEDEAIAKVGSSRKGIVGSSSKKIKKGGN